MANILKELEAIPSSSGNNYWIDTTINGNRVTYYGNDIAFIKYLFQQKTACVAATN